MSRRQTYFDAIIEANINALRDAGDCGVGFGMCKRADDYLGKLASDTSVSNDDFAIIFEKVAAAAIETDFDLATEQLSRKYPGQLREITVGTSKVAYLFTKEALRRVHIIKEAYRGFRIRKLGLTGVARRDAVLAAEAKAEQRLLKKNQKEVAPHEQGSQPARQPVSPPQAAGVAATSAHSPEAVAEWFRLRKNHLVRRDKEAEIRLRLAGHVRPINSSHSAHVPRPTSGPVRSALPAATSAHSPETVAEWFRLRKNHLVRRNKEAEIRLRLAGHVRPRNSSHSVHAPRPTSGPVPLPAAQPPPVRLVGSGRGVTTATAPPVQSGPAIPFKSSTPPANTTTAKTTTPPAAPGAAPAPVRVVGGGGGGGAAAPGAAPAPAAAAADLPFGQAYDGWLKGTLTPDQRARLFKQTMISGAAGIGGSRVLSGRDLFSGDKD